MQLKLAYPAHFKQYAEDEIVVSFPDIPEALTSGVNHQDAYEEAQGALCEALAGRINHDGDIPIPKKHDKCELIPVPIEIAIKVALYLGQKEAKIRKTGLAQQMKCDEKHIRRLLDPHYHSKLPSMEKALNTLNQRVILTVLS